MTSRKGILLLSVLSSAVIFVAALGKSVWKTILFPQPYTYLVEWIDTLAIVLLAILLGLIWWKHRTKQELVYIVLLMLSISRASVWVPAVIVIYLCLINYILSLYLVLKLYLANSSPSQSSSTMTTSAFRYGCYLVTLYAFYVLYRLFAVGLIGNRYAIEVLLLFVGIAVIGHFSYRKHPHAPAIRKLGLSVTLLAMLYVGTGGIVLLNLVSSSEFRWGIELVHLFASAVMFALLWWLSLRTKTRE